MVGARAYICYVTNAAVCLFYLVFLCFVRRIFYYKTSFPLQKAAGTINSERMKLFVKTQDILCCLFVHGYAWLS